MKTRKELIAQRDPKSPISEVFRTLRTNIQFMDTSKKMKTLLLTSTFPGEGKSWVTSNLAVTFAQAGKQVVLIDADTGERIRQFNLFDADKNYFVTSFDMYSLKKGLEILGNLQDTLELTKVYFTEQALKEDDDYLNYLASGYKIIWNNEIVYFPIENGDASIIAENQRVAKIKFRRLSGEYKDGLIYICQEILSNEFNESQIRKTLKNIEKGE